MQASRSRPGCRWAPSARGCIALAARPARARARADHGRRGAHQWGDHRTPEIDLEAVRELTPADEGPSEQTRQRARAALLAEVACERKPRRRPTRPRFGVRLGLAGAAVVAVALLLVLGGTRGGVVRPD